MRSLWGALVVAGGIGLGVVPALADRACTAPLSDWQPREALVKKLQAEGWTIYSIRSDDGCYKVKATNARGERVRAKFDPATLDRLPSRHGSGEDGDGDGDRGED